MNQPSLNFHKPRADKNVTETSRESYAEVKVNLRGKYLTVLSALANYIRWKQQEPTAKELMEYMAVTDPNLVRPRLSEMKDEEHAMRFVEASETPRKCSVTGKNVSTWRLTPRGEAFLRGQK